MRAEPRALQWWVSVSVPVLVPVLAWVLVPVWGLVSESELGSPPGSGLEQQLVLVLGSQR